MRKRELFCLKNNSLLTIFEFNELLNIFKYKPALENSYSDKMELARIDKYLQAI